VGRRSGDQPPLFRTRRAAKGRVEVAVDRAVAVARRDQALTPVDDGLVAVARTVARALDQAAAEQDKWAVARLAGELSSTLARLRLDPSSRGGDRDSLANFLADLARPTPGTPAVGDTA
jgi:hypothetical protein